MTNYIRLPNGSYFEAEEGQTPTEARKAAFKYFPEAFGVEAPAKDAPKQGLMADVAASAKKLLNIGQTGIGALTGDTTAAALEGAKRQEKEAENYIPGFQPEKITEKWNRGEYLSSAGEAARQIPSAIAGLLPSVGQEMGLAALGRVGGGALGSLAGRVGGGALGSLAGPVGTAAGATVGQYAVPLIVNAIQALGSEAQDKVDDQIKAGEKPDVNALELAPYAAANAAANLIGTRIAMPSIFKKAIGQKVAEETGDAARAALLAEATKTAGRGTMATIGRGVGHFAIGELPTEVLQDVIDRAAVGKPLADDDAITQYRNTALNMALAAPLGGAFGVRERSQARGAVEQQKAADTAAASQAQQAQQAVDAAKAAADKQTPEYREDLRTRYEAALAQWRTLKTAAKQPGKDAEPAEKEAYNLASTEFKNFNREVMGPLAQEYAPYLKEDQAARAAQEAPAFLPTQPGAQADFFAAEPTAKVAAKQAAKQQPAPTEAPAFELGDTQTPLAKFAETNAYLQRQIDEAQIRFSNAKDEDEADTHLTQYNKFKQSQEQLAATRPQLEAENAKLAPNLRENIAPVLAPEAQDKKLQDLRKALQVAQENGDTEQGVRLVGQIKQLRAQPALFGEKELAADDTTSKAGLRTLAPTLTLEAQIQEGRAAAEQTRKKFEEEAAALTRIAAKKPGQLPVAAAANEKRIEQARELIATMDRVEVVKESTDPKVNTKIANLRKNLSTLVTRPVYDENQQLVLPSDAEGFRNPVVARKMLQEIKRLQPTLVMKHDQDWARLAKDPENTEYQTDRLQTKEALEKDIRALESEAKAFVGPAQPRMLEHIQDVEKTLAATTDPTQYKNITNYLENLKKKANVPDATTTDRFALAIAAKKSSLENINRRIEIGSRYSRITQPAYEGNLELSDNNVADLIDRLLPTGIETKTAGQAIAGQPAASPLDIEGNRKTAATVLGATSTEATPVLWNRGKIKSKFEPNIQRVNARKMLGLTETLPIIEAQDLLDSLKVNSRLLVDVNEQIQKAGRPSQVDKVAALDALKEQRSKLQKEADTLRSKYNLAAEKEQVTPEAPEAAPRAGELLDDLEQQRTPVYAAKKKLDTAFAQRAEIVEGMNRRGQVASTSKLQDLLDKFSGREPGYLQKLDADIDRLQQEFQRLSGRADTRYEAFVQAREEERTRAEPQEGQEDLFALTEPVNEISEADLRQAKTEYVNTQNRIEGLRHALSKTDGDAGQYLREQAVKAREKVASVAAQLQRYTTLANAVKQSETELTQAKKEAVQKAKEKTDPAKLAQAEKALSDAVANRDTQQTLVYRLRDVVQNSMAPAAGGEFYKTASRGPEGLAADAKLPAEQRQLDAFNVTVNNATQARDRLVSLSPEEKQESKTAGQARIDKLETELETAKKDLAESELDSSVSKEQDRLRKEAAWFERTASVGKAVKQTGNVGLVEQLEKALGAEYAKNEKAKTKLDTLEQQRREYEQQQDIVREASPGQRAAERLQTGMGYRSITGAVRKGPKHKESWGLIGIPKTVAALPNKVAELAGKLGKAQDVLDAVTTESIDASTADKLVAANNRLRELLAQKNELEKLEHGAFRPENFDTVAEEIRGLQAIVKRWGTDAQYQHAQTIRKGFQGRELANLKVSPAETAKTVNGLAQIEKNAEAQITPLSAKLDEYKASYLNAVDEIGISGALEFVREKAAKVDALHSKAVAAYAAARRDLLLFQYEYSKKIQSTKAALQNQIDSVVEANAKSPELTQLIKDAEQASKMQAMARVKLKETEDKLEEEKAKVRVAQQQAADAQAAARAKAAAPYAGISKEAQQRAQEGAGLPGVRYERSTLTPVARAVQINARKMAGIAQKKLERAQASGNLKAIEAATKEIQRYEREGAQAFEAGEVRATQVGEREDAFGRDLTDEQVYQQEESPAVPGVRLPRRVQGPVVVKALQPASQMLSGTAESREAVSKGNRPKQTATVPIRAFDLSPEAANAISLATVKQQLDAAKEGTARNKELTAEYATAIEGLTEAQVEDRMQEGMRLLGSGPTLAVIAARERVREAQAVLDVAENDLRLAKTPAAKELARDARDAALEAADKRMSVLEDARTAAREALIPRAEKYVEDTIAAVAKRGAYDIEQETEAPSRIGSAAEYNTSFIQESLDTATEDALLDGRLMDALESLAKVSTSDFIRDAAEKIRPLILRTKVRFDANLRDSNGKDIPAIYIPRDNTIIFRPDVLTEENLIHEVVHAVTARILHTPDANLTPSQRSAKNEITAMWRKMEANPRFKDEYAIKDVHEFASEVQSNRQVREMMDKQPWYKDNMLARFFKALMRLVGYSPAEVESNSSKASKLIESIYLPSKKVEGAFATPAKYTQDDALSKLSKAIIAQPKPFSEKYIGSHPGLVAEMNTTDMRAGLREALKAGAKDLGDTKLFEQAMYSVTKADQKMPQLLAALSTGSFETYTDSKGFIGVRSTNKDGAKVIFTDISNIPNAYGDAHAKAAIGTTYMIAQRAANKGLTKLDLGALGVTETQLADAMRAVEADPALKAALEKMRKSYNAFNKGLINFNVDTGAITKLDAEKFLKDEDFVPYYRVNDNGTAELVFGGEKTINIGDIRRQPYLAALKGGETKILPLNESLPRNAMLLMDKALTNMAQRNVAYALQAFGKGQGEVDPTTGKRKDLMPIQRGDGPANPNVIRFNQEADPNNPKDSGKRWLKVETNGTIMDGIPAELIVKSLEGAHLTLPAFLKLGGIAGDVLRSGITRMPPYLLRQLFRDPMAAAFTTGLNYGPLRAIYKANKEFLKLSMGQSETGAKLIQKGLIQSGIFTGDPDDISKFALQLASGKDQGIFDKLCAMADRAAMNADAATRVLVHDNAIANGLSEVQADMSVMESMNFHKRGLSPSVQYASRMIPFFNSQIQGLNVLYKAARGQMPYNEQLRIKQKFMNNAMLLMGTGLVYAMAMDDDDYYKKAKPKDRYSNFFLHIPGLDEPLKLPIPYEAGWFFSVAVAAVDAMKGETDGPQQLRALKDMFLGAIPGYSSMAGPMPVPQIFKPMVEVWTNKNFFNGTPLESLRLQHKTPEERYNTSTTEMAKAMSRLAPILSPIQIEHIVSGYLGQLPIMAMAAASGLFTKDQSVEEPTRRITDMPLVGSSFQRKSGGEDADVVFRLATEALQVKASFDGMRNTGRMQDARQFMQEHRAELAVAPLATQYQKVMGDIRRREDIVRASGQTAEAKRLRIDKLDEFRDRQSEQFMRVIKRAEAGGDRTIPQ